MKDNVILVIARKFVRMISAADALFRRISRIFISPSWVRVGACKQCGRCCRLIGIEMETRMARITALRNMVIWWVGVFNGFQFQEWDREEQMLLFTCRHFINNVCTNYHDRPQLCRDYPQIRNYFKEPVFFPECGYSAVPKK